MIGCFDNYITLNNTCSPVAPSSGLYLTDHPAITISRLEQLTGPDLITVNGVFDRIYNRATAIFESEVTRLMSGHFKNRGIVENVNAGRFTDDLTANLSSTDRRGMWIEVNKYSNLELIINAVHLWMGAGGPVNIYIFDGNTGSVLDTLTFTGTIGYNIFQVNKAYSTRGRNRRFFVAYQSQVSRQSETSSTWNTGNCSVLSCEFDCSEVSIRGASVPAASPVIEANMVFGSDSFGLLVNFNLACSVSDFICTRITDFKIAFWNYLAIEFLKECADNDRINDLTLKMDREQVNKILWGEEKVPGLVEQNNALIEDILERSHPASDGICFGCDEPIQIVSAIP